MKVAVWEICEPKISKFSGYENTRVVFKGLDDNKSYYLNLDMAQPNIVADWKRFIKPGAVFDVQLLRGNIINKFGHFTVSKKGENEEL